MKGQKPLFIKQYFWDINWIDFSPQKYPDFTIERILENGDVKSVEWLKNNFSTQRIKKIIKDSRRLSPKSATYWGLVYNINSNNISCLKKPSLNKLRTAWKS
ncbi:MAG: hypothetical protein ABID45_04740 [Patescibacteria group bacterium]